MDDCASRFDFHVGNDFVVGSHEGRVTGQPCPVAGFALLMFLVRYDTDVVRGVNRLSLPSMVN